MQKRRIIQQRWSRGNKARGQGQDQGHKKIPRPRPRTDTLEAKAKDQGHRRKCSPPKKRSSKIFSGDLKNKKGFKQNFQAIKVFKIFFSGDLHLRKPKKRSSQIFRAVSGVFQQTFNGSKNSVVLEPRTGQFSRT